MKLTGLRNLLIFSVAILLGMALAACGGGKYHGELLRAESILDSLPDSAREILKTIPRNTIDTREDLALRDLIAAEVQYKLYEDGPTGADILAAAEETFRTNGDDKRLMRTLFQKAIRLYDNGEYPESIVTGLEGLELAEALCDTLYLAKLNEHIGDIYCISGDGETALNYSGKAAYFYLSAGKERNVLFAKIDQATELYNSLRYKEALTLLDSALQNTPSDDKIAICYLLDIKTDILLANNALDEARRLHNKLIELSPGLYVPDLNQELEIAINSQDKAKSDSLKNLLQNTQTKWYENSRTLRVLSEYHSVFTTPDSALLYADKRMELEHNGVLEILRQSIDKVQTEAYKSKATTAETKALITIILAVVGITVILFIVSLVIYMFYRKEIRLKNKIKACVSEITSQVFTIDSLNQQNSELLKNSERNKDTINSLNSSLLTAANEHQNLIVSVSERLYSLNVLCREFFCEKKSNNARILKLYSVVENEILKIKEDKCLGEIEKIIDYTQGGLATLLRTYMPSLKKDDYIFILFSYLHFSPKTICILCNIEGSYYPKKRKRLKDKIQAADIPEYAKQRLSDI